MNGRTFIVSEQRTGAELRRTGDIDVLDDAAETAAYSTSQAFSSRERSGTLQPTARLSAVRNVGRGDSHRWEACFG